MQPHRVEGGAQDHVGQERGPEPGPPGEGAESYQMLLERVKPWFEALDRQTVCVTHGGVVRTLFRMVESVSEDEAARLEVPR